MQQATSSLGVDGPRCQLRVTSTRGDALAGSDHVAGGREVKGAQDLLLGRMHSVLFGEGTIGFDHNEVATIVNEPGKTTWGLLSMVVV